MVRQHRNRAIRSQALSDELLSLRVAYQFPKQAVFADHLGIALSWYQELENGRGAFTRVMIARIRLKYPDFGKNVSRETDKQG